MAPPQDHMFYIGLYSEKREKILFLSQTMIRLRALIFGMYYHLVDPYQVCSNNALGTIKWLAPGVARDMVSFQLYKF